MKTRTAAGSANMPAQDVATASTASVSSVDPVSFDEICGSPPQHSSCGSTRRVSDDSDEPAGEGHEVAHDAVGDEETPADDGSAASATREPPRRAMTRGGSAVSVASGYLGPIETELSSRRRGYDADDMHPSGRRRRRRDALARPPCAYGMDSVGNHVAAVTKWIKIAHRNTSPSIDDVRQRSAFFVDKLRRTRSSFDEQDSPPRVSDDVFPSEVEIDEEMEAALVGLNACLYMAHQRNLDGGKKDESDGSPVMEHIGNVDHIVEIVARIPGLMKTILLIKDEKDRNAVLFSPVIRRAMLCQYSIMSAEAAFEYARLRQDRFQSDEDNSGILSKERRNISNEDDLIVWSYRNNSNSWLLGMLRTNDQALTDKAIDYLDMVSSLSVDDYLSIQRPPNFDPRNGIGVHGALIPSRSLSSPSEEERVKFDHKQDALFVTIGRLSLLITHLFKLRRTDIERASTLPVIRRALDDAVSLPFFMGIIFFDLVFHIVLLLSFRSYTFVLVDLRQGDLEEIQQRNRFGAKLLGYIGRIAVLYFIFRMLGNVVAMSRISWRVCYANFFDFWQIVEIAAVTMVVVEFFVLRGTDVEQLTIYSNQITSFNAFTIGLLWLNFVGFLRLLNWKFATFVLAIFQIMRDIRQFLLLMLILVLAFGDMFYTIIAVNTEVCGVGGRSWTQFGLDRVGSDSTIPASTAGNETADDPDLLVNESPVCDSREQSYFGIYRVLIGDTSADEFAVSPVTTFLFVLMTFLGVIIMLNILIAIVDESYERSTMKAARLFGRARIALVAKIAALEELLHPRDTRDGVVGLFTMDVSCDLLLHNFMRLTVLALVGTIITLLVNISSLTREALKNQLKIPTGPSEAIAIAVVAPFWYFNFTITTYLATGWERGSKRFPWLQKLQYNSFHKYCIMVPISFILRRILGSSQALHKLRPSGEDEWEGRLNYLSRRMQRSVSETESRMKDGIARLEMRLDRIESLKRKETIEFEKRIAEMEESAKASRKAELEELEGRLVQALMKAMTASSTHK